MVPCFNVRLQRFRRASSIPFFLPLSKSISASKSPICSSSLHWIKSDMIFFMISWTEFGSRGNFGILCGIFFKIFMKAKSFSWMSAFFYWWLPIAVTPTLEFVFTCERGFTLSLNCSIFSVECGWNRILKTIKIWGFIGHLDGIFCTKSWNFSKSLNVANF